MRALVDLALSRRTPECGSTGVSSSLPWPPSARPPPSPRASWRRRRRPIPSGTCSTRNRILRGTDTNENTAAALSAIDTNEPILSFDTANNLQFAIAQYEQIVAAGGWDQIEQEVYNAEPRAG